MTAAEIVLTSGFVFFTVGWLLYFRERRRSRDYATDLMQVVHDEDLGRDDLRRSLNWSEVEDRVEQWADETDCHREGSP